MLDLDVDRRAGTMAAIEASAAERSHWDAIMPIVSYSKRTWRECARRLDRSTLS